MQEEFVVDGVGKTLENKLERPVFELPVVTNFILLLLFVTSMHQKVIKDGDFTIKY